MVMDGSEIIDSLDSLWFFSNVFTSSRSEEQQVDDHVTPEMTDQEEATKLMNQVKEDQQNDETPGGENSVRRCNKCGEFAAEIESLKVVVGQVGQAVEELAYKTEEKKKMRRRRRRRSKRRSLSNETRQIFGELDLGFYGQMEYPPPPPPPPPPLHHHESPWLLLDDQGTRFEYQSLGVQQQKQHLHHVNMKKMPPLNDGLAMKQHLKSWAYAVACTVR